MLVRQTPLAPVATQLPSRADGTTAVQGQQQSCEGCDSNASNLHRLEPASP